MNESLQFDRAEIPGQESRQCGGCQAVITDEYFEANGQILCAACAGGIDQMLLGKGSRFGRYSRAWLFGSGAALLSSAIYYAIVQITGYELAIVSIAIGVFVGRAVKKGSGGRGGWRYQALAAVLTYMAIVLTNLPLVLREIATLKDKRQATSSVVVAEAAKPGSATSAAEGQPASEPAAAVSSAEPDDTTASTDEEMPRPFALLIGVVVLIGFALAAPVLAGVDNIIGLLIIGFGVWEAWRVNRRIELQIAGPHSLGTNGPPAS
jgi:hypothetical protein